MSIQLQEIQSIYISQNRLVEDTRLHQIYRNKLVEGPDYILGEMLKGNGVIQTINDTTNVSTINLKFKINSFVDSRLFGRDGTYRLLCGVYTSNSFRSWGNNEKKFTNVGTDVDFTFDIVNRKAILNGVEKSQSYAAKAGAYLRLFPQNCTSVESLTIKNIMSLTPCKLLRSIPRNLDAQCKSRSAGECGMIDLISGRFYGNVLSNGTFSLAWDEWLKNCTIQFDANYLGWTMQYPPTISYQGRVRVANLPDELTDFGFVKLSKTQVVMGENVWSFNNWGSNTWATFDVSYGGGGGCNCSINGSRVGSQQEQVATELSCSIDLQDIIQINKIEFIAYIDQQTTHTVKFTRGFDDTLNKQYLISDYDNTRIYED